MEVSKGKTVLNINGYIEQGNVVIEIKDDGVGMDRDTLLHLLDPPEGKKRIFLLLIRDLACMPVHQRLRYLYGEEYGLTADSEPGNGTCIKNLYSVYKRRREDMELKILILDDEYIILDVCVRSRGRCMDVESSGKRWM